MLVKIIIVKNIIFYRTADTINYSEIIIVVLTIFFSQCTDWAYLSRSRTCQRTRVRAGRSLTWLITIDRSAREEDAGTVTFGRRAARDSSVARNSGVASAPGAKRDRQTWSICIWSTRFRWSVIGVLSRGAIGVRSAFVRNVRYGACDAVRAIRACVRAAVAARSGQTWRRARKEIPAVPIRSRLRRRFGGRMRADGRLAIIPGMSAARWLRGQLKLSFTEARDKNRSVARRTPYREAAIWEKNNTSLIFWGHFFLYAKRYQHWNIPAATQQRLQRCWDILRSYGFYQIFFPSTCVREHHRAVVVFLFKNFYASTLESELKEDDERWRPREGRTKSVHDIALERPVQRKLTFLKGVQTVPSDLSARIINEADI